jgi:hypothetical protein
LGLGVFSRPRARTDSVGGMKARLASALALLLLSAGAGRAALEFSGFTQTGADVKFVLTDTDDARSSGWLGIGQSFRDHRLVTFDAKEETLTVEKDGRLTKLPLKPVRIQAAQGAAGAAVEPSQEFRAFVASLKISGVFAGANSRMLANDRVYRIGDVVHRELGIRFTGLNPETKAIVFEDKTGARVTRAP